MKKIRCIYFFIFYFFIISIKAQEVKKFEKYCFIKKIINNISAMSEKTIHILQRNKIPVILILTISTISVFFIIKIIKPLRNIEFDFELEFGYRKQETDRPLEFVNKDIESQYDKEINELIECIQKILENDKNETEDNQAKEKPSSDDCKKIKEAIEIIKTINEKRLLEEEVKQNSGNNSNSIKTPRVDFQERDMMKYDANNLIEYVVDGKKSCITKTSIDLLKQILIQEEAAKNLLLKNFIAAMTLLQKTSLKKFRDINVEQMINDTEATINQSRAGLPLGNKVPSEIRKNNEAYY
jgi:hypothetical protein